MVRVTIQGNAFHALVPALLWMYCTATALHDRIHSNAGTKATVKFLLVVVVTTILLI